MIKGGFLNHQLSTINYQPSTINHQPSTINEQRLKKRLKRGVKLQLFLGVVNKNVGIVCGNFSF